MKSLQFTLAALLVFSLAACQETAISTSGLGNQLTDFSSSETDDFLNEFAQSNNNDQLEANENQFAPIIETNLGDPTINQANNNPISDQFQGTEIVTAEKPVTYTYDFDDEEEEDDNEEETNDFDRDRFSYPDNLAEIKGDSPCDEQIEEDEDDANDDTNVVQKNPQFLKKPTALHSPFFQMNTAPSTNKPSTQVSDQEEESFDEEDCG